MPQVKRLTRNIYGFKTGINTNDNAHQIGAQLREAQNVRITDEGNVRKREGYSRLVNQVDTEYVSNIFQHIDNYGNKAYFAIIGDKLYQSDSTFATWTEVSDPFGITKSLVKNTRASMLSWKGQVVVSNGENPAFMFGLNSGLDFNTKGIWVADSSRDDVQIFNSTGTYLGKYSIKPGPSAPGTAFTPRFMDVDTTNNYVYMADAGTNGIVAYDFDGNRQVVFNHDGTAPWGVAIDNTNNHLYVSDTTEDKIYVYDMQGNQLSTYGSTGTGNGEFDNPRGMWVDETNDELFVCDYNNSRIQILTVTPTTGALAYSAQFGSSGTGNDNFAGPSDVWGDSTHVWITDSLNNRIKKHQVDGTYVGQLGSLGTGNGEFDAPFSVDSDGTYIYVVDRNNMRVQYFSTADTPVYEGKWGSTGTDNGEFTIPEGIALTTTASTISIGAFRDLGAPPSPAVADSGTAGNPDGTYKYKITYATETGLETTGGVESEPITVVTNQINVTLPISTLDTYRVDEVAKGIYRNIYRSKLNGTYGPYNYVGQVADNTTTTFTDNIADASVGVPIPVSSQLIPACKYMVEYADILWGAGNYNNLNYLYWTDGKDPHAWQVYHSMPIGEDDKGLITGLGLLGDHVIVFKDNSIYAIRPDYNVDTPESEDIVGINITWRTKRFGGTSHFAIQEASIDGQDGLIFLDKDHGVCFLHGGGVAELSVDIMSDFTALDKIELRNACAVYYPDKNLYMIGVTNSGSTNNQVWVFNTLHKCWVKPWVDKTGNDEGFEWSSCALIENSSGTNEIWSGDFNGTIYKHFTTETDGASGDIEAHFTTGWIDYGIPYNDKVFDRVTIDFIEKGAWSGTFYWAMDGAAFSASNSVSFAGTAGVRDKATFTLPNDTGQSRGKRISYKIENNNASEPFEIVGIQTTFRVLGDLVT